MLRLTWLGWIAVFAVAASLALAQTSPSVSKSPTGADSARKPSTSTAPAPAEEIPERTLKFTPVDTGSSLAMPSVTSVPQCDTDGYLFLSIPDPKDLKMHTVVSIKGRQSQTYLPSAISDLHDVFIADFFPSSSAVGFLVRGAKDLPGALGPHKSPAGIAWSSYHYYIAEFDRDGSYKGSVQLPVNYQLYHFAIFPSGEFLVSGYDQLNSTVRLLLLSSSGQIVKDIDLPAARTPVADNAPYRSVEGARAVTKMMSDLQFTPYNQDILVWRHNSNDPILDVTAGGGVREVPLQTPPGFVFAGMIPSNDRWVGHFRTHETPEYSRYTSTTYSYFELRPQDASLSSKLLISGDDPQSLACESDGSYITYKVDKNHKMVLLKSN
jgi:hypothetical protein